MRCSVALTIATLACALFTRPAAVAADEDFFEKRVRPVLAEHCYKCHGPEAVANKKLKGGLRLDARDAMLKGGDSGPAVVPGKPDEGTLLRSVRYADQDLKMPPKAKLPAAAVADLERWVKDGATWPDVDKTAAVAKEPTPGPKSNPADHWAFKPVRPRAVPDVKDGSWARTDIDRFVLSKVEARGLKPADRADKRTLIRRVTFDLTGLPPTPEEVAGFLADDSTDAFAKVVDRLLASPAYGQRWGRHWLDLARYADTNGADENYAYPNAWRYRDYVVDSFNADVRYDRFVREQVAGDLLPPSADPAEQARRLTATGFLVIGPKLLAEQDKAKLVMDVVDEQVDVVGQTFLGLTLGCARCHDHKFDPVSAADYYALAGVFKSTRTMADLGFVSQWLERDLPNVDPAVSEAVRKHAAELAAAKGELKAAQQAKPADKMAVDAAKAKVAALEKAKPTVPRAMAVEDAKPVDVPVHVRGSHLTLAPTPTPRGVIGTLAHALPSPTIAAKSSGRLELADWLVDPANPLVARVMVNRVWQGHFGIGLVASSSNFGLRGSPPTHPELLDYLAGEFVKDGWSIKRLHRWILLSATYQMDSVAVDPAAATIDPENALLSHQNRRRLEAEPIRDALLATTGGLDRSAGGSLAPDDGKRDKYSRLDEADAAFRSNRRAMYLPLVRSRLHELFTIFDYTDAGVHTPRRPVTTVPGQALFMLNNDLVAQRADALAAELLASDSADDAARVATAYERLYARPPTPAEVKRALDHVAEVSPMADGAQKPEERRRAAWASLVRVLLAANEFVYVR